MTVVNAMRKFIHLLLVGLLAAVSASCGSVVREGRSPMILVIDLLQGPTGTVVQSDVRTEGRIDADLGRVALRIVPKDINFAGDPLGPSSNNEVTVNRYRVSYRRSDGRKAQGVDVPYAFDGAVTGTVRLNLPIELGFVLVRNVAKAEAPLAQLVANPVVLTTIADVTFYGRDRVGNDINVTGSIQVDFGNFADSD